MKLTSLSRKRATSRQGRGQKRIQPRQRSTREALPVSYAHGYQCHLSRQTFWYASVQIIFQGIATLFRWARSRPRRQHPFRTGFGYVSSLDMGIDSWRMERLLDVVTTAWVSRELGYNCCLIEHWQLEEVRR